jgi:TonB family protein
MSNDATTFRTDERIGSAFARSVALHLAILGGLGAYAWWQAQDKSLGGKSSGVPMVGVELDAVIPLPSRGPENPLANDTPNETPQAPPEKPAPKEAPPPDPKDAIAIKSKETKSKQKLTPMARLKSFEDLAPNQLRSSSPQAASSKLMALKGGSEIGAADSPLGTRFEAYASLIQDITHRNWHVDRSIPYPVPVTVHFDLQRDGSVRNVQLTRTSGIEALDLSVLEAVQESHYPPLPDEYEKSSAPVEFTFRLKK